MSIDLDYQHPTTVPEVSDLGPFYVVASEAYEADLADHLPAGRDSKILDVGCGWGQFLWFLAQKGYADVRGIDVGTRQIEHCQSQGFAAERVVDTVHYLKKMAETFDLVTMHHVIEHMPPDEALQLLRAIRAALKPGGRAIIQTPNMSAVSAVYCRFVEISHCTGYCESNLHQIMGMAGFQSLLLFGNRTLRRKSLKRVLWRLLQRLERAWWRAMLIAELGTDAPKILSKNLFAVGTKL